MQYLISRVFAKNTMPFASEEDISFLLQSGEQISRKRGALLYMENDPPEYFYVLVTGKVELSKHGSSPQKRILAFLKEGNIFGLPELFCTKQTVTAQCVADCELLRYSRMDLFEKLSHNRILMLEFLEIASRTIETLQNSAMVESSEEKIENYLMWMIIKCGTPNDTGVRFPRKHTHEQIAEMLCLSRERVTKMFSAMRAEERIAVEDDTILVMDSGIIAGSREYNHSHIGFYGAED